MEGIRRIDWARIALVAILAVAVYARLTNLPGVFIGGEVFYGGQDSYYHMHRVELTVAHYPVVPAYDAWSNYPEGAVAEWPIGFDLALATLCKLGGLFVEQERATAVIGALFCPLLGVLCCYLIYRLGWGLLGRVGGLIAGGLAAILPMLTGYSMVGRVDHHAAEPLLLVVPLLLLLRATRETERKRRRAWALGAGVALGLGLAFWSGVTLVGVILLALIGAGALLVSDYGALSSSDLVDMGRWLFGAATVTVFLVALPHPWFQQGKFISAPSWLQPVIFAIGYLSLEAIGQLWRRFKISGWQRRSSIVCVPLLVAALTLALVSPFRAAIVDALQYMSTTEAQISQVHESRSLFAVGAGEAAQQYSLLLYLAWLPLVLLWWRRRRGNDRQMMVATMLLYGITGTLAVIQLRLGSLFAPLWCVGWAASALQIGELLQGRRALRLGVGAAGIGLLVPTMLLHRPLMQPATLEYVRSYDALLWLRHGAASPGDPLQSEKRPHFAVMSRWQWGHWLTHTSRQANIANALGQTPTSRRGVAEAVRLFLETDPDKATAQLDRLGGRYVLVTPVLGELRSVVTHTDRRAEDFVVGRDVQPLFMRTLNSRLMHFDGLAFRLHDKRYPPLRGYRLVFESRAQHEELGRRFSYAKVFERVKGARLVGTTRPNSVVALSLRLRTNLGRPLTYRDRVEADSAGRFELRVPYATRPSRSAAVRALTLYQVRGVSVERGVDVTEAAVVKGQQVAVR